MDVEINKEEEMPVKNVAVRFLLNGSPITSVTKFYVVSTKGEKSLLETDETGCYKFVDLSVDSKFFVEHNGKRYFIVVTKAVDTYDIETAEKKPVVVFEKKYDEHTAARLDAGNKKTELEQSSANKTNSFNYAGLLVILLSLIIAGGAFYVCWKILFDNGFNF